MSDDDLIAQWDEQMETARAALEQAFKIADAMADRIDAYAERERIATDARRKSEARAERLEAALEAAKAYIEDLEAHEGAEGFSLSTAILSSAYYAALKGADHE